MSAGPFRELGFARVYVGSTVSIGVLAAVVTVVQMVLLARVVDLVFLRGEDLAGARSLLWLLLAFAVLRALLWLREVVAMREASG